MSKEQWDALDLLITTLQEHEKRLDATVERVESAASRLEELILDREEERKK